MSNFWQDQEEFRDMPDEVVEGQQAQPVMLPPTPRVATSGYIQHEPVQQLVEEVAEEEEDDFTEVLSDASLRLEQGNLYKMIMNHSIFQGMDADPRAIRNVEREIKRFARERMEIMLGMRQEKAKEEFVSSPFNDLEVTILKKLASAASKGATEKPEANQVAAAVAPKKTSITPIGGSTKTSTPTPVGSKQEAKKLAGKPAAPLARKAAPTPSVEEDPDADYTPLEKPAHELTPEELAQRNKEAAERQRKRMPAKNPNALPQPSYEQEEMYHMTRAASATPAVSAIIAAINNKK